jgi:hypothetical protein
VLPTAAGADAATGTVRTWPMRMKARASRPLAATIAGTEEPSFVATDETVSPDLTV